MEYNIEAHAVYKSSFPSDAWLQKYFGPDVAATGTPHPHWAEISTTLYAELRRAFDTTLAHSPHRMLKAMNGNPEGFSRVYVFNDGIPAEWINPVLESYGLVDYLSSDAFRELCGECIAHYQAGALGSNEWWAWSAEGDSVWAEIVPSALVDGKIKRRTLAELTGRTNDPQ